MTVLIVTPDRALFEKFHGVLQSLGRRAADVADLGEFERRAKAEACSLALLDWNLVSSNPREKLKRLRQAAGPLPMLLFGAESVLYGPELSDAIGGGAGDFLLTSAPDATLAAKLRLYGSGASSARELRVRRLRVDRPRREVRVLRGKRWAVLERLTPKEFDLLCFFLESPGADLSRGSIMKAVWGGKEGSVNTEAVDKQVASLRRKLGAWGGCIRTRRGVGYRLVDEE